MFCYQNNVPEELAILAEAHRRERITNHLEVVFQNHSNLIIYYPGDALDSSASGEPPSTVLIPEVQICYDVG